MASQTALGTHVGISRQAAVEQCKLLGLKSNGRGGYDLDEFRLAYCGRLRKIAAGQAGANGGDSLAEERARLAREQADAVALKNAIDRKQVAPLADIGLAVETVIELSKARLRRVPAIVARGDDALRARVEQALDDAMEELSRARVDELVEGDDDLGDD